MTKIIVDASSKGDGWPHEEIDAIRIFFESRGYIDTSHGSGTNAVNIKGRGKKWWAIRYERDLNDETTEEDLDIGVEITDPDPVS